MPGVVLVSSDSLRADHLGPYGATDVHTPNLDRFAAEATVFDRNYAASYPTAPNRLDLWTGQYSFLHRGWTGPDPGDVTLPGVLDDAGIVTKLVYDTPVLDMGAPSFADAFAYVDRERGHHPDNVVSDPSVDPPLPAARHKLKNVPGARQYWRNAARWDLEAEYIAPRTFARGIEWLERNRERDDFFLMVDAWDPHELFDAPDHYLELYADLDGAVEDVIYPVYGHPDYLSEAERQRVRARYAASVTMVDTWMGRLLDALDRFGLAEETLVIFTSDHGHLFGDHDLQGKPTGILGRLYEESIRTPLVIRDPRRSTPDRVEEITQPPDLPATILEYFDRPPLEAGQGASLVPLLAGDSPEIREYAITGRFPEGYGGGESAASGYDGWAGPERVIQPVTVTGKRWALVCHPRPEESELYDLAADPDQAHNVIEDHPEVAADLREVYLDFARKADGKAAILEPFESEGEAYERESLAADTTVYVFEAEGIRFAHLDTGTATRRVPEDRDVARQRFGALVETAPDALVYLNQQYYRATELVA